MDKTVYWKRTKILMMVVGTWPADLISEKYQRFYRIFQYFPAGFYLVFMLSLLWGIFDITLNNIPNLLAPALNIFITYSIIMVNLLLIHSKAFRRVIVEASKIEDSLTSIEDKAIDLIRGRYSNFTRNLSYIYTILNPSLVILFLGTYANARLLPFYHYLPFNKHENFLTAILIQAGCVCLTSLLYISGGCLVLSLFTQIPVKLEVLQYMTKNIDKYALNIKERYGMTNGESVFITTRSCIIEHQELMSTVKNLNNTIRSLMLLEFITNSMQLAANLLAILSMDLKLVPFLSAYLFQRVAEIMALHYTANEIKVQSLKLPDAIFQSNWIEFEKKSKDLLRLMILSGQKPLLITIGQFGELSLETALKIFKSAYTLITFVEHRNSLN